MLPGKINKSFLGAFAKLWKATISFIMSIHLSFHLSVRIEQLGSHWTDINEIWYLSIFRNTVKKILDSLTSDKNNGYFTYHFIHCTNPLWSVPITPTLLGLGYMIVFSDISIWRTLDFLACIMQFVKLSVILCFTLVFHFKFVLHTITIVYLNFIVYMLICFYHLHMSYYYV